jgi:hypothetical protein
MDQRGLDLVTPSGFGHYGFTYTGPVQDFSVTQVQAKTDEIINQYAPFYAQIPNSDVTLVGNVIAPLRTEENRRKLYLLLIAGGLAAVFFYDTFGQ